MSYDAYRRTLRGQTSPPNDFVAMAVKVCPVCAITHNHGAEILIRKQLRPIPEDQRCTGWHFCEQCEKMKEAGYIALVGIDPAKTDPPGELTLGSAHRLGRIVHAKRDFFQSFFTLGPEFDGPRNPLVTGFVLLDEETMNVVTRLENERAEREGTPTQTPEDFLKKQTAEESANQPIKDETVGNDEEGTGGATESPRNDQD